MPSRVPDSRNFRFNRYVRGVGRITNSARTSRKTEFDYRNGILTKLIKAGALETLQLFKNGRLTIEELVDADRQQRLEQVAERLLLHRRLDVSIEAWLPESAKTEVSQKRYGCSWRRFQSIAIANRQLTATATIHDLNRVDYHKLKRGWGASDADWNRMRAMLSAFLSDYLGHMHHPFRLKVMGRIPRGAESDGRVPQTTPEEFWCVVMAAEPHVQASYVAMAVLGVGPGEYLGIREEDLSVEQLTVVINGTKTPRRRRVVAVDERLWGWIERAVPSQLQYKWLRTNWGRACKAAGVSGLRMYDLRHLSAQYAGDRGVTDRDLTIHLGHTNPTMSHRYSRRATARGVAKAIGDVLAEAM